MRASSRLAECWQWQLDSWHHVLASDSTLAYASVRANALLLHRRHSTRHAPCAVRLVPAYLPTPFLL